ncbi:MAG: sigma-70 family RNA polymerase sigma factor [Acidobacteriota bacterium]
MSRRDEDITTLLVNWSDGNEAAGDQLMLRVEKELRQIANRYLYHERPDHTLQATALINEAYLRLIDQQHIRWQNRAHFFAIAAQLMRRILIDHARIRNAAKRGGQLHKVSLEGMASLTQVRDRELIALDDALKGLAVLDPRKSRIVELRFFGGLTIEETAEVLKVSIDTVKDQWKVAKAWLYREINKGGRDDS